MIEVSAEAIPPRHDLMQAVSGSCVMGLICSYCSLHIALRGVGVNEIYYYYYYYFL
jgi:hypothetical protein